MYWSAQLLKLRIGFSVVRMMIRNSPVSYTHLDVYKRQHYDYLANDINATAYYNPSHSVNVYYTGLAGKTETRRYNVKKAAIRKIGLSLLPIH